MFFFGHYELRDDYNLTILLMSLRNLLTQETIHGHSFALQITIFTLAVSMVISSCCCSIERVVIIDSDHLGAM